MNPSEWSEPFIGLRARRKKKVGHLPDLTGQASYFVGHVWVQRQEPGGRFLTGTAREHL